MGYIYKLTSPTNKVYIGQAVNLKKRLYHYKHLTCSNQKVLLNSLRKYGFDSFTIEVIEQVDNKKLDDREIYWIGKYKANCTKYPEFNGMNCTDGGGGCRGYKHTDKWKRELKRRYEMGLTEMGARYGKMNGFYGKHHTEETKAKIAAMASERQKVPVVQYSKDGEYIREWDSIKCAADTLSIDASGITKACKGKQRFSKGWAWRYKSSLSG